MLRPGDSLAQSLAALGAHKLRSLLTMLGLTMGVATLITVMTLIEGANRFVETKIARLGTDVLLIAKTPFTLTNFDLLVKSVRYKRIEYGEYRLLADRCRRCDAVGATMQTSARARRGDREVADVRIIGNSPSMARIDTQAIDFGRWFTPMEDERGVAACMIGATVRERLFEGQEPVGKTLRIGAFDCTVIARFEKVGSILGQDADNFVYLPLETYRREFGSRATITINLLARGGLDDAQDESRLLLRAIRHRRPNEEDDFFFGTKENFIELWQQISGAFFAVFILVSAISALVGGIVIMNVMLVNVTERTKEIGVRRALGATQADISRQFLTESVLQCLAGGLTGVALGFLAALALRRFTDFPASVEWQVALLGLGVSSAVGLFFGIYPAIRAAHLDPVEALRSDG